MDARHADVSRGSYRRLGIELAIDFVVMYLVMYAMIASLDDFYPNLNTVYMTLMMVTPMVIVMIIAMRSMFPSPRVSLAIGGVAAMIFGASLLGVRLQAAVDDAELVRSMIPHHSGAILMCREADVTDAELLTLCSRIIESQQREIDQMRDILSRLTSP